MRIVHHAISTSVTLPTREECAMIAQTAKALGGGLDILIEEMITPQVVSALGGMVIDIPSIRQDLEDQSRRDAAAVATMIMDIAGGIGLIATTTRVRSYPADFWTKAAEAARRCDISLCLVRPRIEADRHMAEALIFESGRPVVLMPPSATVPAGRRIAVAWDGSRVAARALHDAAALYAGAAIVVLVVGDEKRLGEHAAASQVCDALRRAGRSVETRSIARGNLTIAQALQNAALDGECDILAMGGFGHSRLRDFVLGGATAGVLADLRLPVLLSH